MAPPINRKRFFDSVIRRMEEGTESGAGSGARQLQRLAEIEQGDALEEVDSGWQSAACFRLGAQASIDQDQRLNRQRRFPGLQAMPVDSLQQRRKIGPQLAARIV